jgi:hypothetical protein
MLYRDGERLTKEDLSEHIAILKDTFPTFFRKENPLSIKLDYRSSAKFYVESFRPGGDVPVGKVLKSPQPYPIKCVGYEMLDGFRTEIRYSEKAPTIRGNDILWDSLKIRIGSDTVLRPSVDLEKLIFLWFYSPYFSNNECINKVSDPKFEFIIPEKQVESKYDNITFRRKLEDEILIEGTRMSYDAIKSIAQSFEINLRGEEKVDRVKLFDTVMTSNVNYRKYNEAKSSIVLEKKSTVSEVVELTQVKNIIANLVDNLKIFDDEKGAWRIKGPGKPKFLCDIEGETPEEKLFNLVEFVSSNPEVLQSVKSLVK